MTVASASRNVASGLLQNSDMISILSLRLAERRQPAILHLPRIEQKGSVGGIPMKRRSAIARLQPVSSFANAGFPCSIPAMRIIHDVIGSTFLGLIV